MDEYYYYDELEPINEESDEYASKCTNRIPIIFKHLCVDWNTDNGFIFSYHSNLDPSNHDTSQTSWFYPSQADKIASAKVKNI